MGRALYPHRQWKELAALWESFYPTSGLKQEQGELLASLEATMPAFVNLLVNHRPKPLRGKSLFEVMATPERQPARLATRYESWRSSPTQMRTATPTLAFAVIGQAKADGKMTPEEESRVVGNLLTHWALQSTLGTAATCAAQPR
jgi:hypothetical protein